MKRRVSHSKYKNTGILFELLARQVTADTLSGRDNSPALSIIREFFGSKTELGRELQLYRALLEASNLSEAKALKFIDLVLEQRTKVSNASLAEQKFRLVRSIKESYPLKEFLRSKIPNYKVYASIYKTFLFESRPDTGAGDVSDVATARFTIVEHMVVPPATTQKSQTLIETFKAEQEDLRLLTYRILVDKFNAKYKGLGEEQRVLLREYINNISNTNSLREHINTEVPRVKQEIQARIPDIEDKVVRIKLQEVCNQMETIMKGNTVDDNQVTALMIGYEVIREIDRVQDS